MKRMTLVLALAATIAVLPARVSASAPHASIPGLKTPGTITFGTNFPYPPMEYFTGENATIPTGADVDLGKAIASQLHLKATFFDVTDFGVIITGLRAHRWDVILSSMNVTPDRAKSVNFITYANVGQSILVRKGNPEHISTLADLSGKAVAVQAATTEVDSVNAENVILARHHKPKIILSTFPQDSTAVQGLATGRFVAILEDYPVATYNATQRPTVFQIAGKQFATAPYGMAFRKSDTMLMAAVKGAFQTLRKNGTYARIFKKYGLSQAALK